MKIDKPEAQNGAAPGDIRAPTGQRSEARYDRILGHGWGFGKFQSPRSSFID
ncbi:MAG: hypothetical protein ACTHLU_10635 [Novosphingobium sp.]